MAGVSFTGSRLSAITGTSSATAGTGLGDSAFIIAVLDCAAGGAPDLAAASFGGGDFTGAALLPFLPPLMACNTGLPLGGLLPGFTLAALPAVLTALLALAISLAPECLVRSPRLQCYG